MKVLGIILIVAGVIALAVGGFAWTDRDTVADVGPVQIQTADREYLPIPPIAGAIAVFAGIVLVFASGRRRATV